MFCLHPAVVKIRGGTSARGLNSIADDAQRKAQEVARHVRCDLNQESHSDSDDSTELPPKKHQARKTVQPATSSTENIGQRQISD